jgi:hypothetical protein
MVEASRVEGILFRQYFVGSFAVGGDGVWVNRPFHHYARWPLTRVSVTLDAARFVVDVLSDRTMRAKLRRGTGGTWSYHEVKRAQVFVSPLWARGKGVSEEEFPVGIRLHFGESRSALLIFTTETEVLLGGLESHQVKVERTPIKLNPMLLGRR